MAWSRLQSASNSSTSGGTLAVAYGTNLSSGTKLIAVACTTAAITTSSVKDGAGNSFTKITARLLDTSGSGELSLWAMDTPAGDVGTKPTITATYSGSGAASALLIQEVSGLAAGNTVAAMIDGTPGSNGGSSAQPTSPTYSSTASNEYLVECYGDDEATGSSTWTAPAGYTADANSLNSTSNVNLAIAYKNSTGGSETGAYSLSNDLLDWAQILCAFKLGSGAATPSKFYPVREAKGRPAIQRGRNTSEPGAKYVSFPSRFTPPRKPAKSTPATRRGTSAGSRGAKYIEFPSAFYAPRKPARGAPGTRRGTSSSAPGARYIHITPPGPSPFTLPVRPAKGAPGIRRGTSLASPGAPYFHVSAFVLPIRPAKGAPGAVKGSWRSSPGAPYVTFPSPFILPREAARGAQAIRRGRSTSSPGARFVLIRISPFVLPKAPARGRSIARAGKWSAGSATGQGAPVVPRQLIISLASMAGTDDYGNTFPQGILATAGVIEGPEIIAGTAPDTQVELISSGGIGQLLFQLNNALFGNGVMESAVLSGFGQIALNGPKLLSAPDFVGVEINSNNGSGGTANFQFDYTDANGVTHTYLAIYAGGVDVLAGIITAVEPGTGTSDTNAATAESWHFASLPSGWTNDLIYKLYPDNTVGLAGTIILPASGSYNGVTICTLPTGYIPQGTKRIPIVCLAQSTGYGNNSSSPGLPYIQVTTSGAVSFGGLPASINSSSVSIDGVRYPLDV